MSGRNQKERRDGRGFTLGLVMLIGTCLVPTLGAQIVETERAEFGESGDVQNITGLVVDRNGNVIVAGWTTGSGAREGEIRTVAWSPEGEEMWNRSYRIAGGEEMEGRDLIADGDGGVWVAGLGESGDAERDLLLLHYHADGSLASAGRFDGGGADDGAGVLLRSDRSLYLLGWNRQGGMSADLLLIHVDSAGTELWRERYGNPEEGEYPADFLLDGSDAPVVAATVLGTDQTSDILLTAWRPTGEVRWSRRYDIGDEDYAVALDRNQNGTLLLLGTTSSDAGSLLTLIAVADDGSEQWRRTWGEPEGGTARALLPRPDGGWVVAAERVVGADRRDLLLLDVDVTGNIDLRRSIGSAGREYRFREMAFDHQGNLLVLGTLRRESLPPNLLLLSVGSDGTLIRESEFDGGGDRFDLAGGLKLDPNDRIVVAATGDDGGGGRLLRTLWFEEQTNSVDGVTGLPSSASVAALEALQPNPFVDATTISWQLRHEADITLEIHDVEGRLIETLFEGRSRPGRTELRWRPVDLPSGVYICRLTAGDHREVRKVLYQKREGG